jgi:hypothetical protein
MGKKVIRIVRSVIELGIVIGLMALGAGLGGCLPRQDPGMEPLGMTNFTCLEVSGSETDALIVNQVSPGDIVEFRDGGMVKWRLADGGTVTHTGDTTQSGDYSLTGDLSQTGNTYLSGYLNYSIDVQAVTTDTTMTAAQSGRYWSNQGATVTTTLTLPSAAEGLWLCYYTYIAQQVYIDPASGDQIHHLTNAVGDRIGNATAGDSVCLVSVDTTYWVPLQETGTWSDED